MDKVIGRFVYNVMEIMTVKEIKNKIKTILQMEFYRHKGSTVHDDYCDQIAQSILELLSLSSVMGSWVPVSDRLPEIDQYVIWIHENGYCFMECLDKDWDAEYLEYFLGGYGSKEISGPILAWMNPPNYP